MPLFCWAPAQPILSLRASATHHHCVPTPQISREPPLDTSPIADGSCPPGLRDPRSPSRLALLPLSTRQVPVGIAKHTPCASQRTPAPHTMQAPLAAKGSNLTTTPPHDNPLTTRRAPPRTWRAGKQSPHGSPATQMCITRAPDTSSGTQQHSLCSACSHDLRRLKRMDCARSITSFNTIFHRGCHVHGHHRRIGRARCLLDNGRSLHKWYSNWDGRWGWRWNPTRACRRAQSACWRRRCSSRPPSQRSETRAQRSRNAWRRHSTRGTGNADIKRAHRRGLCNVLSARCRRLRRRKRKIKPPHLGTLVRACCNDDSIPR